MKKTIAMAALALAVSFGSISCKKNVSDADLQTSAAAVVTSNPNAKVEVKDGTAHLSGTFADQASKDAMIASLKAVPGVKDVMDMSTIAAVAPAAAAITAVTDPANVKKVKDALKDFPSVKTDVVGGVLTLTGNVSPTQARKIKESIDGLKIGKYTNNLTVK